MRGLTFVLSVSLLALVPLAGAAQNAPYDTPPDFAVRPTGAQMVAGMPAKARQAGVDGEVMMQCFVTASGGLRGCRIVSEKPADMGFGGAALALAPQFLMKPATKGGRPVESAVNIPMFFPGSGVPTGSFIPGDKGPKAPASQRIVSGVIWRTAPTYDQVAAAYPEKARAAKVGGRAVLNCVFGDAGKLRTCSVLNEYPGGQRFGEAARKLFGAFTSGATRFSDGVDLKGASTQVAFTFDPKILERRDAIVSPKWLSTPTVEQMNRVFPAKAKAENVTQSRVVLECRVSVTGGLEDCKVASETPAGYGFGQAALSLVPVFRMPIWADDGSPVVGATIRLPIRYDLGAQVGKTS